MALFAKGCANPKYKHGQAGTARSAEYRAYQDAKKRCNTVTDKHYDLYGGRGIEFRFASFQDFFKELGPRPDGLELDRIDNDGHYEVGNVRWTDRETQVLNSRHPKAKLTESHIPTIRQRILNGEKPCLIAGDYHVSPALIYGIKNKKNWAHIPEETI
jgi:hypothetical protein